MSKIDEAREAEKTFNRTIVELKYTQIEVLEQQKNF